MMTMDISGLGSGVLSFRESCDRACMAAAGGQEVTLLTAEVTAAEDALKECAPKHGGKWDEVHLSWNFEHGATLKIKKKE